MCGIAFLRNIEQQESTLDPTLLKIWTSVLVDISQRGPDLFDVLKVDNLQFAGAVLHIQGNEITRQPYVDPLQNSILLWNGEVFDGLQRIPDGSDTQMISAELSRLTEGSTHRSISEIGEVIVETLSRVQGPYAFIYYSPLVQAIFYGRDPFGRRSLMALSKRITEEEREQSIHNHLLLSSVCLEMEIKRDYLLEELPVSGIFCMPLNPQSQSLHFPWPASRIKLGRRWDDSFEPKPNSFVSNSSEQFLTILKNLLIKRIHCVHSLSGPLKTVSLENTCSIGVLFSGGIDSVLLAAVLHLALPEGMNHLTIDLLNVTFEGQNSKSNDPSPDRLAAIAALGELEHLFPRRSWRLVHVDVTSSERNHFESRIFGLIQPLNTHMDLNIGTAFWFASRGTGYIRQYTSEEYQRMYQFEENGRPLLRLGEEGARKGKGQKQKEKKALVFGIANDSEGKHQSGKLFCSRERCRKVSKPGCPEVLCRTCCEKDQKEREAEMEGKSSESISSLCPVHRRGQFQGKPHSDDLSLQGDPSLETLEIQNQETKTQEYPSYRSPCKILLVGIGADEQMAGYGRHRTTFEKFGWHGLVNELHSDMTRLWTRNLGRDDRCASDHGRELWFPFLDEEIVQFLQNTSIDEICDLSLPYGVGDKKILRDAGKLIGLTNSTELVKRAIQFGTRVAKHTNVKFHGSNRKGKGTTQIEFDES